MQKNEDFIVRTWPFLLVSFVFIIVGIGLNKYYGEDNLHLMLNQFHVPIADYFFKYFTKTGELLFGIFILIYIVWKSNWRMILTFLTAAVLQSLLIISLKRMFFIDHHRPGFYFQERGIDLHLVDGIQQGITYTFPSGHTATAFFVFLFVTILLKNPWLKALCGILAVLGALSRIYLSQHFMQDTVAGAIIGISCSIIAYYFWLHNPMIFLERSAFKK